MPKLGARERASSPRLRARRTRPELRAGHTRRPLRMGEDGALVERETERDCADEGKKVAPSRVERKFGPLPHEQSHPKLSGGLRRDRRDRARSASRLRRSVERTRARVCEAIPGSCARHRAANPSSSRSSREDGTGGGTTGDRATKELQHLQARARYFAPAPEGSNAPLSRG